MAKLKRFNLVRPEIEAEIIRPILGRLWLLVCLPCMIRVVKTPLRFYTPGKKETYLKTIYYLAIPKIKVVDCVE